MAEFPDTLTLFRDKTPKKAPVVFNRGPDSLLWSVQRRFPLSSDCAGKPGKLIVSVLDPQGASSSVLIVGRVTRRSVMIGAIIEIAN
jgi:hypothetical protein